MHKGQISSHSLNGVSPPFDRFLRQHHESLLSVYEREFCDRSNAIALSATVIETSGFETIIETSGHGHLACTNLVNDNGTLPQRGDTIDVVVIVNQDGDYFVLSAATVASLQAWLDIERAYLGLRPVLGKIVQKIAGGFVVDVGVPAFLPSAQVESRLMRTWQALIGTDRRFRIIAMHRQGRSVLLSHKILIDEERAEEGRRTLATLAEGDIRRGVVKNVKDYGVFVDLGGVEGLLHISDISCSRSISHPSELFQKYMSINVVVLRIDRMTGRISLAYT